MVCASSAFNEYSFYRPHHLLTRHILHCRIFFHKVVDAAVVAQKLSEAAAGGEGGRTEVEKMRWRRQQGMHMFKMPGDTRGVSYGVSD